MKLIMFMKVVGVDRLSFSIYIYIHIYIFVSVCVCFGQGKFWPSMRIWVK